MFETPIEGSTPLLVFDLMFNSRPEYKQPPILDKEVHAGGAYK